MRNKVLSMLGLAARGNNLVSGEYMTEKTIKEQGAFLVLIAQDASANTKKMFGDMCSFYHVPLYEYADKETLAHAIGKETRASLAVTDEGIARTLINGIEAEKQEKTV